MLIAVCHFNPSLIYSLKASVYTNGRVPYGASFVQAEALIENIRLGLKSWTVTNNVLKTVCHFNTSLIFSGKASTYPLCRVPYGSPLGEVEVSIENIRLGLK